MAMEDKKTISIRYPVALWRRLKLLEIDGEIESIAQVTLDAVEKEVTRIEKKRDKKR